MSPARAAAYGRVIKTLDDMGAAKLHADERELLRSAADSLLFAAGLDGETLDALAGVETLTRHLANTGRWSEDRAVQLADDVAACGPSLADAPPLPAAQVA